MNGLKKTRPDNATSTKMKFYYTSWDDGHPADKRLSALLAKYDLEATFYIPGQR